MLNNANNLGKQKRKAKQTTHKSRCVPTGKWGTQAWRQNKPQTNQKKKQIRTRWPVCRSLPASGHAHANSYAPIRTHSHLCTPTCYTLQCACESKARACTHAGARQLAPANASRIHVTLLLTKKNAPLSARRRTPKQCKQAKEKHTQTR